MFLPQKTDTAKTVEVCPDGKNIAVSGGSSTLVKDFSPSNALIIPLKTQVM